MIIFCNYPSKISIRKFSNFYNITRDKNFANNQELS